MKWFYMAGPGGTIAIKAEYAAKAKREAAERWGCGSDEITVTGEEPYNNGTFVCSATEAQVEKNAASGAGTPETAGEPMERRTAECRPYGYSDDNTKRR